MGSWGRERFTLFLQYAVHFLSINEHTLFSYVEHEASKIS